MHVLEPKELEKRRAHRSKKQKKTRRKRRVMPAVLFVLALYCVVVVILPLASLQAETGNVKLPTAKPVSLPWPAYGQAALGAVGYGLLAQNGDQKQVPIASVAKVITAVAVLKAHPMLAGEQGETITITAEDVATYNRYDAEGQSVVKVETGEKLTEYQALQALLLPSANNMADILVRWAFGSTQDYIAFVNPFTKTLGMQNTTVADASGFSPGTKSTAVDLAVLAEIAMNHPVVAEIASQAQATLPVAGVVYNINAMVGHDGIVGIKTGNTDQAGGCYLFAAKRAVDGNHDVTVVGAIIGAPDLESAIKDSLPLLAEAFKNFQVSTPVTTSQVVGIITQSGGGQVPIKLRQGIQTVSYAGQAPTADLVTDNLKAAVADGDKVGVMTLHTGNMSYQTDLVAGDTIAGHSIFWRLRHAAGYL